MTPAETPDGNTSNPIMTNVEGLKAEADYLEDVRVDLWKRYVAARAAAEAAYAEWRKAEKAAGRHGAEDTP